MRRLSWLMLFAKTVLAALFYIFMEWVFFVTKPSFMDAMPVWTKIEVFLLTGLTAAAFSLACFLGLRLLGFIPGSTQRRQVFLIAGAILPAFFLAAISLMLIDNFTYTLFKFGIVTSQGTVRAGYALLAVILFAAWYRQVIFSLRPGEPSRDRPARLSGWQKSQAWAAAALLAVAFAVGAARYADHNQAAAEKSAVLQRQPNIILLGGESLLAGRMSVYEYERDTTPRLRKIAGTSLVAMNNFTNASETTGSVISMLTGKYPARTRVLYAPNILQGEDAYQHLPGILQRAGYYTEEISFPYYVDAYDLNMQEAFDKVNGRSIAERAVFNAARQAHFEEVGYFLPQLYERLDNRLLHIFFIKEMPDPYHQVIQAVDPNKQPQYSDEERIQKLIHLLKTSDRPVFAHVHLMGTHGQKFYPRQRVYSAAEAQNSDWMKDFYDDAMLDFDAYVGELLDGLSQSGLLDNTVIIIYGDHTDQWRANGRIPLIIHFPRDEFSRRIQTNTQNLDIAPTILDYLGMEKPAWMEGQSILRSDPPSNRRIISAYVGDVICNGWWCTIDPKAFRPPFYQFASFQLVECQNMYILNLKGQWLSEEEVRGHTAPCPPSSLPSRAEARQILLNYLQQYGFDISSLETK